VQVIIGHGTDKSEAIRRNPVRPAVLSHQPIPPDKIQTNSSRLSAAGSPSVVRPSTNSMRDCGQQPKEDIESEPRFNVARAGDP